MSDAKKRNKELKQEQDIAEGLATIQEARESVDELAKRYVEWIDQAAELGEDEYSDQLIADQIELEEFSRDLEFIEVMIRKQAISARALGRLKALPKVVACCKSLPKGLDLPKIGKQLAGLKDLLANSRISLKDLRRELSDSKTSVHEELFGKKAKEDPKISAKIAAKKQAREARLATKIESNKVSPVESGVGMDMASATSTDIDAITAMIDEERKKK